MVLNEKSGGESKSLGAPTTNAVFEKVHEAFIDSLSGQEKACFSKCSSPEELLQTLRNFKMLSTKRQKKTLNMCLDVVKRFNDKLRPYFDAINVIASANDSVAVVYGALRLVFELASGFPTFFEKLIVVLDRLSSSFPQYSAIVELFEGSPPARIRRHLESVYSDLFRFIQMATRIFTASSGKVKRPLHMITSVIWKPFDAQFSSLLNSMEEHRLFIMDELEIHQAQQAKDAEKAAAIERARSEDERQRAEADRKQAEELSRQTESMRRALDQVRRESTVQRILEWLAPPRFAEALENSQEQREEGTAEWIFESQIYKDWLESEVEIRQDAKWKSMPPWVLWVHGNPGSGKTILASSVIEEISEANDHTCYFFLKHNSADNSTLDAAYRSILAQILHRSRDVDNILDIFTFARVSISLLSGQRRATSKELGELIRLVAHDLGRLTLILDGIDEAVQPETLAPQLKELVTESPVKLVLFSRSNINSLHKLVDPKRRVAINSEAMSPDISLFLEHQLQEFAESGKLPDSANIEELAKTLLHGADGMFLWAKLMINYLSSFALSPHQRLATINSVHFPEGLNAMYDRILSLITTADALHVSLARRILMWISHVSSTSLLTCSFLYAAIMDEEDAQVSSDFASTVMSVCGGLVEFNPQQLFQFTHLTVKDYLKGKRLPHDSSGAAFIPDDLTAAEELTMHCLRRVCRYAPAESPDTALDPSIRLSGLDFDSFGAYAFRTWALHLSEAARWDPGFSVHSTRESTSRVAEAISSFLENPFAIALWIEVFYGQVATLDLWNDEIKRWLLGQHTTSVQEVAHRLSKFFDDLNAIDREWGDKLHGDPALIWTDVPMFPDSGIAKDIAKVTGTERFTKVEALAPKHDNGDDIRCLTTISSLTSDGGIMATLGIYPSPSFELFWRSLEPSTAYEEAERHCSGWTAKYEIWSTEAKKRIASATLPLPSSEICLLVRQSFRQDPYKNRSVPYSEQDDKSFETSFALAIGPDCLTFSILRTVYTVKPGESTNTCTSESAVLPLELLPHYQARWGSQLATFDPNVFPFLEPNDRVGWRDWYTYSVSFSSKGDYIAFADYQIPCLTHIAIFEIVRRPTLSARLFRSTSLRRGTPRVQEVLFHKESSLVAFLAENKVWVWELQTDESAPICLSTNDASRDRVLESLKFSACGMYLLARDKAEVEVLPVPTSMLDSKAITQPAGPQDQQHLPSITGANSLSLQLNSLGSGSSLSDSHLVQVDNGSNGSKALLVTTTDHDLKIAIKHSNPSEGRRRQPPPELRILSLPASFSTENTSVNLQIPATATDSVRVIFNKRPAESYSLSDGRESQNPAIVERKFSSMAQIEAPPRRGNIDDDDPRFKLARIDFGDVSGSKRWAGGSREGS